MPRCVPCPSPRSRWPGSGTRPTCFASTAGTATSWPWSERVRGTEAHVLSALDSGIYPAESFGRIHHLPKARLAEVMDGLRCRGLVDASGRLTDAGRATKGRIEALTDLLAEAPYHGLDPSELDQLIDVLEPISKRLEATGSQ